MNQYKQRMDEIWKRVFCYQDDLEKAIVVSGANRVSKWEQVERIKSLIGGAPTLEKIAEIFHDEKYLVMFHFKYDVMVEGKKYQIFDWCSLFWRDGIQCHFEWMDYGDDEDELADIPEHIKLELDEIFYQKRKSLLGNFLGGAFVRYHREEEFSEKLCDRNFIRV